MPILIDGYNLLNAANIVAIGPGPYSLEKSRRSLLHFLMSVSSGEEQATMTVVFDGREAPPGLDKEQTYGSIRVLFSAIGTEADDLIEDLLPTYSAPRSLTVVSSDHRVQRAARRVQATAIDSDAWVRERLTRRAQRSLDDLPDHRTRPMDLSKEEIAAWIAEFEQLPPLPADDPSARPHAETDEGPLESMEPKAPTPLEKAEEERWKTGDKTYNPFPEGYGEDLLE